jgi:C-terminal processing protease CtpA/Prc
MGDTTAGSSGNPKSFSLGGGWQFSVPQWIGYTREMEVIEWNGITPDVVVSIPPGSWEARRDPVIEAALTRANQGPPRN